MALIKSVVKLLIREQKRLGFTGQVLALGTPEIYASPAELCSWFPELAGKPCPVAPATATISTNEHCRKLGYVDAATYFRALGLGPVVTMDIPGCEHVPDVVHDLNQPFAADLQDRFDVVLDAGTTEHVFDMKTCLSSIAGALKVGGVVIQQVPVYSYNGGYYSINPIVLIDFYRANGFTDLSPFLVMWDRYWPFGGPSRVYPYTEERLGHRHALADYDQCRFVPHLLLFARKARAVSSITVPIQFEGHYTEQDGPARAGGWLRTARDLCYRLLPYPTALYLHQAVTRWLSLRRTRRDAFWI